MMTIENRNLKPGTHLVANYHKERYTCMVVTDEGGKLLYILDDGREFKSPSSAGTAITGKSCNGWAFWSVDAAEAPPMEETSPAEAQQESATDTLDINTANIDGVPEGQTRWYCRECGESFVAPTGEAPQTCPQGHQVG
jgi:hypothetical protein